jgi:diadenosine tetraphosphate (Ap4A) HIT family hydrolase
VTAIHELTPEEVEQLGPLVRDLSLALRVVVGCQKTYVMQFAEAPDHSHVHFHVVPRMADFSDEQRGANVFAFLGDDESKWVDAEEMDRIALAIGAELEKP